MLGLANAEVAAGAEVMLACKQAPGFALPGASDPSIPIVMWRQRGSTFLGRVARPGPAPLEFSRMREFAPDIVHVHGEFNPDNLCVASRFPCPLVVTPHGCFLPGVFDKRRSAQKRMYFRLARHLLYRHAAFHATSPLEAEHIRRLLPDQQVYCSPLGPGVQAEMAPSHRRMPGDGVRLLFIGRLDIYTKGLDLLLDAVAQVARGREGHGLSLHLMGGDQGGSQAALQLRARELGIAERVVFHGQCAGDRVAEIIAQSDLYVQLSRHEGFGLSIVEALFSGLPAVLSDEIGVVSYPEVGSLTHVALVPPAVEPAALAIAAMVRRLGEASDEARASAPGLRRFFSWKNAAATQLERYAELIATRSRSGIGSIAGTGSAGGARGASALPIKRLAPDRLAAERPPLV